MNPWKNKEKYSSVREFLEYLFKVAQTHSIDRPYEQARDSENLADMLMEILGEEIE